MQNPERLSKVQEAKWKSTEEPSEFLERVFKSYRLCADTDPEDPENLKMVNDFQLTHWKRP